MEEKVMKEGELMSQNQWNPEEYQEKMSFVSSYGTDLLTVLAPQVGEKILDLGCGTGDLTAQIATFGTTVVGIDSSKAMIQKAHNQYPELDFRVGNGERLPFVQEFDGVFSNAALHWMNKPVEVILSVANGLKKGGRFVAEFGGKGNVATIIQGIEEVVKSENEPQLLFNNPWYFPSIGEYSSLLETHGLEVESALLFERPTPLVGKEKGLTDWLTMFGDDFFLGCNLRERKELQKRVVDKLKPALYCEAKQRWTADYKRIRIVAKKP